MHINFRHPKLNRESENENLKNLIWSVHKLCYSRKVLINNNNKGEIWSRFPLPTERASACFQRFWESSLTTTTVKRENSFCSSAECEGKFMCIAKSENIENNSLKFFPLKKCHVRISFHCRLMNHVCGKRMVWGLDVEGG
jgi:hypothetical protein